MRNLFLGYFHTPKNKRAEVLRLMGNVVGLERDDVDKVSGHTLCYLSSDSLPHLVYIPFLNPVFILFMLSYFLSHKVCLGVCMTSKG